MYNTHINPIKLLPLLALILLITHTDAFADCRFNEGRNPNTPSEVLLKGPGVISIPADLENNRTIYEGFYIARATNDISCNNVTPIGLIPNPALGPVPASGYLFPIKDSGVALQIFNNYAEPDFYKPVNKPCPVSAP